MVNNNDAPVAKPNLTELYPYVALYPQASNIHPNTGRLVTLDGVAFNDAGEVGDEFHAIFNTGGDPGPRHMHGVDYSLFDRAPKFGRHLRTLDRFIDGRTLIVHDAPFAWGFIVSESRRAMNAAARANRSRNRRQGRRRQRVGHVPTPIGIVDTLATARKQGTVGTDARLDAVAAKAGIDLPSAEASVARAAEPEETTSRARSLALMQLYLHQREAGDVAKRTPDELTNDRFGLQRSRIRIQAEKAEPTKGNPGVYTAKSGLRPGMEVVVTDDVAADHDEIVQAILDAGMVYTEKLSRETSLVISNITGPASQLRGKAMHAERKNIPLLTDDEFFTILRNQ